MVSVLGTALFVYFSHVSILPGAASEAPSDRSESPPFTWTNGLAILSAEEKSQLSRALFNDPDEYLRLVDVYYHSFVVGRSE